MRIPQGCFIAYKRRPYNQMDDGSGGDYCERLLLEGTAG